MKAPTKPLHVDCDVCGTITETQLQTIEYPHNGRRYRFEAVEMEVCPRCGFSYYSAHTLRLLENHLLEQEKELNAA